MRLLFYLTLFALSLHAKILISPFDAMKMNFSKVSDVSKKNVMLSKTKAAAIEKEAKAKLSTKIYRVFTATQNDRNIGYGILIPRKVRSKDAVILYMITPDATLKAAEVIAFNEPIEYLPSSTWMEQFDDINNSTSLRVGKGVSTITGATLSARSISDGARLALAIFKRLDL